MTLQWKGAKPAEEQIFGTLVGARFYFKHHWWRIESASLSEDGLSLQAALHPLLADYNRVYPQVSGLPLAGRTLRDLSTVGIL